MSRRRPMVAYALTYQRLGWPVLPLDGKRPIGSLVPRGVHDATLDPETAREWWALRPDANIGVAMGGGRVAVDVDPRNGGDSTLAALIERNGQLPATVEAATGGGGAHFIFSTNGSEPRGGTLGEGVDFKAAGGYIVVHPSVHPTTGERYGWRTAPGKNPLAPLPEWIEPELTGPKRTAPAGEGVVREGERHNRALRAAGWLRREGYDESALLAALHGLNGAAFDPCAA